MKKTSTRLATIGGIVVLGAFAIALAQHDARKREREQPTSQRFAVQPAVPIPLDEQGEWSKQRLATTKLVVRGNNDKVAVDEQASEVASANPLRTAALAAFDESRVIPASGDAPPADGAKKPTATAAPPSWLGGAGPSTSPAGTPALPSTAVNASGNGAAAASGLPSLPSFPMNAGSKPPGSSAAVSPTSLPSLNAALPTAPPTLSSEVGDMSDTQRGAMQPTNLLPAAASGFPNSNLPASPPAMPGNASPRDGVPQPGAYPQPQTPNGNPSATSSPFPTANPTALPTNSGSVVAPGVGSATLGNAVPPAMPPSSRNTGMNNNPATRSPMDSAAAFGGPPNPAQSPSNVQPNSGRTTASLTGLVSNLPGSRFLDGSQNPVMLIQKRAPEEIQVGKKATFVIAVRNAGNAAAHDVTVVDSVPRGARFEDSAPPATPDGQGMLTWKLGEMAAGDERTITLQIVPEVQGEVGSVASVHFAAQASVRTVATLPKLELQLESQPEVLIGGRQQIAVTIKNSGTGVARGVRLEADIPELLKHASGETQLEAVLGDLRPNEMRRITLDSTAVQPGMAMCAIRATSDDGAAAQAASDINVLAPQLVATIEGPRLRYLERQATYHIKVQNTGTAAASNLDFVVRLPAGLQFNSANNRGSYDPAQHTVSWGLHELPAGETAPMELTVLPVQRGPQTLTLAASGDLGIKAEAKGEVMVDGLAELAFSIRQDNGTIEVGTSTTYSVEVTNVGNKPDKDVRLVVQLPAGARLLAVDARVEYKADGNQIVFAPVAEMSNKDQYIYRFQVQHDQPGTQIVRTQLTSANWPVAVIKEEGTLVYNDQN